ncbi:MAG: hydroxysqualene dehydroxylase HpnE [Polaromonas sp.]
MKIAVVGAGWAGCAAAVEATRRGHHVTIFEASRTAGGRARRVDASLDGQALPLDNGQHILIGAYTETLSLMADLGIDAPAALLRMPLTLQFPDGSGIRLPRLPAPFDALFGILSAKGWTWRDRLSLLRAASGWQLRGFQCDAGQSVADLCRSLSPGAMASLIEPLCVSALNTPPERASGQVFLRVLRDSMFSISGGSNLLLPRADLSALLPDAALSWLTAQGGFVQTGVRVKSIVRDGDTWQMETDSSEPSGTFDAVLLACPPTEAARLAEPCLDPGDAWLAKARGLQYEGIATVYAMAPGKRLELPMLTLHARAGQPAQFVFDRGQLGGPAGLLAFVVSASVGDNASLTAQVHEQAAAQLGLQQLQVVQTIVEKRATFACTPGLQRPGLQIAPGLLACGDYVEGPYPATLEGAVRAGLAAARHLL